MKLNNEIKQKIDNYFAGVTAEELYDLSLQKYKFSEENQVEFVTGELIHVQVDLYFSLTQSGYFSTTTSTPKSSKYTLAA